ncbi:MAG: glycosyltransferase family 4 protein [Dehalococcoidia bacterium]
MKIALVSPYDLAYPGGVANHIFALEREFIKMGHEAIIIAPASQKPPASHDRFICLGKSWPTPSSGSVARVTLTPWLSAQVKPILKREKFDVIHLHEPLCPMLCTTILRLSDSANVGTFHAMDSRGYDIWKPFTMLFLKKWFRRLDGKIAVSKPAREFINGHFPGEYNIIPNGVDLGHFSPDIAPFEQFLDGKINIVFVSRLEKRKGVDYLLKAYQQVKKEINNCRLILVGPSTRWSCKLVEQIRDAHLNDIVITGFVSQEDLPRYYQTADIVCSPATGRESFGLILLEAMAMGKPIVASNIDGYASVATHSAEALLVPPKDEHTLAQALITLASDVQLRKEMGARGKIKAAEYGWDRIAQRVMDYYQSVLDQRSLDGLTRKASLPF